jgi:hypothetical protein
MVAEPIELMVRRRLMVVQQQNSERVIPFSCSTNLANDVSEHLSRIKLGGAAAAFCFMMHRLTFGNAGKQRDKGHALPGLWCDFNLAIWSKDLGKDKSNVRRIRADLEECHIIRFIPDEGDPGKGRLEWNLNFTEWTPYNQRPTRSAANATARTQRQANVVILTDTSDGRVKITTNPVKITTPDSVKITTNGSLKVAGSQSVKAPLRRVTEKRSRNDADANASGGAAIAVAPATVVPSRRQRKTTKTETPPDGKARASPSEGDGPLNAYRAACWKLLRDKYGQDVAKEGRELAAMKRLFERKIPLEDVEGCWHATLIDPRWDADPLTLAIVEEKLTVYRRNPDGYKAGMLKKRRDQLDREKMQAEREKRGSTNGQNPAISRARPPGAVAFSDAERDAERARRAAVGE